MLTLPSPALAADRISPPLSGGDITAVLWLIAGFGEARLLEAVRAHAAEPAPSLLEAILGAVQRFSGGEQSDDMTLLVARAG